MTVDEGAGVATISVTKTGATSLHTEVGVHSSHNPDTSATPDVDYVYSSFAVMFAPEDTVKTVEIPIIDDAMHEADESFTTQLIQGFQSYLTFGKRDGVVTITDNDPTPTVTIATAETTEGGTLEFAVTLSNPTVGEAIIGYHVEMDGAIVGAGPDADLRQKSGLLIIPEGETEGIISIPTLDDSVVENTERVLLHADNGPGVQPFEVFVRGTIFDNDIII